ncbi:MAG: hypothetical protein V3U87_07405 [Methylococcaceae bacterium]
MKLNYSEKIVERPIDLDNEKFTQPSLVILLGAGVSKDAGFPICADLQSPKFVDPLLSYLSLDAKMAFSWLKDQVQGFEVLLAEAIEREDEIAVSRMLSFYEQIFLQAETQAYKQFDTPAYIFKLVIYSVVKYPSLQPVFITFNHDLNLEYASYEKLNYNYGTLTNKLYCLEGKVPSLHIPGGVIKSEVKCKLYSISH